MTSEQRHEHPGDETPHRHNANDELAMHASKSDGGQTRASDERVLELREEELEAHKRSVQTGEVRVDKDVWKSARRSTCP